MMIPYKTPDKVPNRTLIFTDKLSRSRQMYVKVNHNKVNHKEGAWKNLMT